MADGRDADPVTYGRWQEAHTALTERVAAIEAALRAADPVAAHSRLADRIAALEDQVRRSNWQEEIFKARARLDDLEEDIAALAGAQTKRKDRQWNLILVFLSGLALPLVVAAVIAVVTVFGHH